MKKVLSLFMVCLCAVCAWAGEVTFDATVDKGQWGSDDDAAAESITKDGVTISCTQGRWNLTDQYRVFKNATFTVSSESTITKVVINCTANGTAQYGPGNFTGDDNYTYEGKVGTWVGSANEINLVASGAQVRITSVVVTIDGEVTPSINPPHFNPAGGTYYTAQNVVITAAEGATIYYTTDGNDPTTASTVYSAPIAVNQTTTIKAIATKDDLVSTVASATYTIADLPTVDNIAAYAALDDNTVAMFNNPVTVTFANGRNVYVKDATGYMCIYGSQDEIKDKYGNGDVIPAGFSGKKTIYNTGLEMASPLSGFQDATTSADATPEEVTIDNFSTQPMWKYVIIKDAIISNVNGKNVTLTAEGTEATVAGYNQFNITVPSNHTIAYDVIGIVTSFQGNLQLYLLEFVDDTPLTLTVDNIAGLLGLEQGVNAIIGNPVTAVYQSGNQLYINDNSGFMLVYGHLNTQYNNGDQLTDIAGSWTMYNGMTEMVPLADYFTEGTPGTPVEPVTIPIEEIDQSLIHNYLRIENCSIDSIAGSNGRNFNLTDETGTLIMRLNFNEVTIGEDFDYSATYNVEGFLAYYEKNEQGQLQFYPNLIDKVGGTVVVPGDVDGDGVVTAGDITILYNILLNNDSTGAVNPDQDGDGAITAGDVTVIYNILLGN
ncbi:MAG: chitobiase/beta-hexosaminidase C-terminal domain-containing protein [Muribaculaceae bacterium]|nr:chitobiase/beta-hexosaminidase C-terminal domain-containing protein [Muribaculaceae bacterium]MBR6490058.1 chitobiase/beta-hexosaminidase C-terminal domain-containing protein [Muribaculaceae bacterium]